MKSSEGPKDPSKRETLNKLAKIGAVAAGTALGMTGGAGAEATSNQLEDKESPEKLKERNTIIELEIGLLREMQDVDINQINSGMENPAITSVYTSESRRAKAKAAVALVIGAAAGGGISLLKQTKRDMFAKSQHIVPDQDAKDERAIRKATTGGALVGGVVAAGILLSQPKEEHFKLAEDSLASWIRKLRGERTGKRDIITKIDIQNRINDLIQAQKKNSQESKER